MMFKTLGYDEEKVIYKISHFAYYPRIKMVGGNKQN